MNSWILLLVLLLLARAGPPGGRGATTPPPRWRDRDREEQMSVLLRAGELSGRPVVTLSGERLAEVKDVIFDRGRSALTGFTLNNPDCSAGLATTPCRGPPCTGSDRTR